MFCSKCGSKLNEGDKFCPKCGNHVEAITKSKKTVNKKAIIIIVALIIIAVIAGCILIGKNNKNNLETKHPDITAKYDEDTQASSEQDYTAENMELIDDYYVDILLGYQAYQEEGFPEPWDALLVNWIFSDRVYYPDPSEIELYYAAMDLAGDGIPELFISDGNDIYDIFEIRDTEFPIAEQVVFTGSAYLGNNIKAYICENGFIKVERNGGSDSDIIEYYEFKPSPEGSVINKSILREYDEYTYITGYDHFEGELRGGEATKEEYVELKDKYPIRTDIKWHRLSEFESKYDD